MSSEHQALIEWSAEQASHGLPTILKTTDPAWFAPGEEAWSVVVEFAIPPSKQGSPSRAKVRFLMSEAPHSRLVVGATLHLFERATTKTALLTITG
jgi:hypothetical protein